MNQEQLIIRDPLLDPQQKLLGYQFGWTRHNEPEIITQDEAQDILNWLLIMFDDEASKVTGNFNYRCFTPTTATLLIDQAYAELPAQFMGLIVTTDILSDASAYKSLQIMRQQGYEILLRGADLGGLRAEWLTACSLIEVHFEAGNFSAQAKIYSLLKQKSLRMAASSVQSWQEYAVCSKLGLNAFSGHFYLAPPPSTTSKSHALSPSQTTLLRLMEAVRANAEISKMEELLKHDAAISYKLLFYINSAAFGFSFEIESLRHAIQMLGYENLYRWLCVLFATADEAGTSPALMQAALIRGRMLELLGKIHLSKADGENLFITGMFSLLDRLLGVGIEQALEHIWLPEAVIDALVGQTGMYLPFLNLARACETDTIDITPVADALGMNAKQINQAHFEAIAWAQHLLN